MSALLFVGSDADAQVSIVGNYVFGHEPSFSFRETATVTDGPGIAVTKGHVGIHGMFLASHATARESLVIALVERPKHGRRWWQFNLWRRTWHALARFALRRTVRK